MTIAICGIEPSVQMRLYTLSKRHFFLVFLTFFTCFLVSVLIGANGPPVTEKTIVNSSSLQPIPADLKTGPFFLETPPLKTFHQQLWLILHIFTDPHDGAFEHPFQVGLLVRGILEDGEKDNAIVYNGIQHNHTRLLKCNKESCDDLVLLHLGYLDYRKYTITVYFYNLDGLKYKINDVVFEFIGFNPEFTLLEIWFRFAFILMTFIATCLFAHSLRKFSMRDWSTEQKWMSLLLPLLLLYNNPIFPMTFLANSWFPGLLDGILQATFLCTLLLFWLCLYHSVRQNKHPFTSFYLPKLIITGSIWLAAILLVAWQEYHEVGDPTYNYELDTGGFMAVKVFFVSSGIIYVLYLVYQLVRAYSDLKSMPYFDLRLKFTTSLMLIVLLISLAIVMLRFGMGMFRAHSVTDLSTHYHNSAEFLSFYALLNFYLYTMAYVYSPSKNAVLESHFKDNPGLSMFNDSEDEVIYGSETEETTNLARKSSVRSYDSEDEAFN